MAVLEHLEPCSVFSYFEQLCAIPHGSGNTKAISDYLVSFAVQRGLNYYQDDLDNVIIYKPATPGYEQAPTVILQGHMDMVCDLAPDCTKDMEKEGLDLAVDGDIVYAKGTTLGGDDGIAVAIALAILDSDDLPHPNLEVLITSDEEIGMIGAMGLDASQLQGRMLISLDSDTENVLFVGCAGGNMSHLTMPLTRAPYNGTSLNITVSGLLGGHSGVEIDLGRGNAIMLLGRVLRAIEKKTDLRVISAVCNSRENAIPSTASAVISAEDEDVVRTVCAELDAVYKAELHTTDPGVTVSVSAGEATQPMDEITTNKVICLLTCAPNGIQVMSADMPGLVQTSLNFGSLICSEDSLTAGFCLRSSVDTQTDMMVDRLEVLAIQLGGTLTVSGAYPGWAYRPDSPLRKLIMEIYTEQYGHEPEVKAVHAGAECGLFVGKLPGLDCLCFSPTLTGLHTWHEKMHIGSVQRVWNVVIETLRRMK